MTLEFEVKDGSIRRPFAQNRPRGNLPWQKGKLSTKKVQYRGHEKWSSLITIQKISIMQVPYNPYHAEAFGLVFKLSYAFWKRKNPRLEIFLDDDEARESEWETYGTLLDAADDRFADVSFGSIGEEREFEICSSRFRIMFKKCYSDTFIFPNGSRELMPVYQFLVKPIP